jgi:hypothetical protein
MTAFIYPKFAISILVAFASAACVSPGALEKTQSDNAISKPQSPQIEIEMLNYARAVTPAGNELSWHIENDGKGWLVVPSAAGHVPSQGEDTTHRYLFRQGFHSFAIGPQGYRELRKLFADVINGNAEQSGLTNGDAQCLEDMGHLTQGQLAWTRPVSGQFKHPLACLGPKGFEINARVDAAWRLIARHMVERDQFGAIDEGAGLPGPDSPLTIEAFEKYPNTGMEFRWRMEPDGVGWLDISEDFYTNVRHIPKGRHALEVGREGYRAIRTELDPYISGPERLRECLGLEDDQAMVVLSWKGEGKISGNFRNDMGCKSFAARVNQAAQIVVSSVASAP